MIDSHCHLADPQFTDLEAVLDRAKAAGVLRCITIGDTLKESEQCVQLATAYPQLFCTVGVHPHEAKHWQEGDAVRLRSLALSSPRVKAIGEIGLDYHYDHSPRDAQHSVFDAQLQLAKELDLPVVVHCREAIADVRSHLEKNDTTRAVIHCCSETWEDVESLVKSGIFLSFTGIATYPSADVIRRTIEKCPLNQLMIETDSPYLSPVPHRGKRNEPAFVVEVAKMVASLKGISLEEVDRLTTENTVAFFGLGAL